MVLKSLKIVLLLSYLLPGFVVMGQVGMSLGHFVIESDNTSGRQRLSNLGHLRLFYEFPVVDKVLIKPSYSLYLIGANSHDFGYGMDINVQYFPLSFNRHLAYKERDLYIYSAEKIRPYATIGFHQRQYQSIQSNYAGPGFGGGFDYQWRKDLKINAEILYLNLAGPLEAKINEIQFNLGSTLEF